MIKNSQDDNPRCSTRDGNLQPSRPFSARAATGQYHKNILPSMTFRFELTKFMHKFHHEKLPEIYNNFFQ